MAARRWAGLAILEIEALIVGLAASDRDGSIDHTGKALWAELEHELEHRLRGDMGGGR